MRESPHIPFNQLLIKLNAITPLAYAILLRFLPSPNPLRKLPVRGA